MRKVNSRTPSGSPNHSRPTSASFSSSGEIINDDLPRPPPRVASVRGHQMGKSKSVQWHGSRESLDRTETSSPVPPTSNHGSPQVIRLLISFSLCYFCIRGKVLRHLVVLMQLVGLVGDLLHLLYQRRCTK